MTRRAPALNGREVDAIVAALRARPFAASEIADRFHVSTLTVERIARARHLPSAWSPGMTQPILILTDSDRADVKLERDRRRRLEEYARRDIVKRSRAGRGRG